MYRLFGLAAMILFCASARAEAVELFTNFHYGENVGFPPMQVPYGIYGGLGRGGWNPNAEGIPLKTWPDVPPMMPTGQIPGGFRRFSHGGPNGSGGNVNTAKGNQENLNRNAANMGDRSKSEIAESQTDAAEPQFSSRRLRQPAEQIAANPRRGRWLRAGGNTPDFNGNSAQSSRTTSDNSAEQKLQPTPARLPTTTVLHADDDMAPRVDALPKTLELPD